MDRETSFLNYYSAGASNPRFAASELMYSYVVGDDKVDQHYYDCTVGLKASLLFIMSIRLETSVYNLKLPLRRY